MTGRERVRRTLTFEQPDRPPRDLWALPGVIKDRTDEYNDLLKRYPRDLEYVGVTYGPPRRVEGDPTSGEEYIDEWGSRWGACEPGMIGEVKGPVLDDWSKLDGFEPPWELFDEASVDEANRICAETDKFRLVTSTIRPFERLQFLRGTEQVYMDLALGGDEIEQLISMVHEYNLRDLELMLQIDGDACYFWDDWGSQHALLISPDMWRSIFKPMYREYAKRIHDAGKFVFMHSDGHIEAIYPDLIEIGVNAVNSQLFCMDMERLGREFAGKITFWGEIDRQNMLPFGTPEEIRAGVRRVRENLDLGTGGVIVQCEWGLKDPKENLEAVYDEWSQPHPDPARRYPAEG